MYTHLLSSLLLSEPNEIEPDPSFEIFTAIEFQVEIFCVVTQYSVMVGYRRFGGLCCPHLQDEMPYSVSVG
jgi:hypothetical protein